MDFQILLRRLHNTGRCSNAQGMFLHYGLLTHSQGSRNSYTTLRWPRVQLKFHYFEVAAIICHHMAHNDRFQVLRIESVL